MDDTWAVRVARGRREPISITLADLSTLVVGSALAFFVPRLHHLADSITIGNVPMPGWVACLFVLREVAMKGGLILVPVIVARCARYGGLPRPADWLAILVVLPWAHEAAQLSGSIKRFARWYLVDVRPRLGYPVPSVLHESFPSRGIEVGNVTHYGYEGFPADFTPGDEYRIWGWFAAILLLSISTALGFGWKRISGWAKTLLLSVAAFAWLAGVTYLVTPGLVRASEAISGWIGLPSNIAVQITLGFMSLPEGLLLGVPVVAVLFDLQKGVNRSWIWTGWVGATTALLALPIGVVIDWYADLADPRDPVAITLLTVQALRLIAVGLTSWIIVKYVGWAGNPSGGS